jgi:hypothetical protein
VKRIIFGSSHLLENKSEPSRPKVGAIVKFVKGLGSICLIRAQLIIFMKSKMRIEFLIIFI